MDCEHMVHVSKLSCALILNMEIAFAWVLYTHTQIDSVYGHLYSGYGERVVHTIELRGTFATHGTTRQR